MKIYSDLNVYDMALKRIERLFDEFDEVIVGFSGGKDSTVCFHLALQVAYQKKRLPLRVMFIDQEAEYTHTITYMRDIMNRKDVLPMWYQIPLKISNGVSHTQDWLQCWEEGAEWIREKEPNSIHKNIYGTETFAQLFENIPAVEFPDRTVAYISGVRTQESPTRFIALTADPTYKDITYGKRLNVKLGHYTFYPLYDWEYTDIWKAIHDNKWQYCKIYDLMYQKGVEINNMRVSSLHHATAIHSLYSLQELEPEMWNAMTKRVDGVDTTAKIDKRKNFSTKKLPYMFKCWREYRDYLLLNLITNEKNRATLQKNFDRMDRDYEEIFNKDLIYKRQISTILTNDIQCVKLSNFERRPAMNAFRNWKKKGYLANAKYLCNLPLHVQESVKRTLAKENELKKRNSKSVKKVKK